MLVYACTGPGKKLLKVLAKLDDKEVAATFHTVTGVAPVDYAAAKADDKS